MARTGKGQRGKIINEAGTDRMIAAPGSHEIPYGRVIALYSSIAHLALASICQGQKLKFYCLLFKDSALLFAHVPRCPTLPTLHH